MKRLESFLIGHLKPTDEFYLSRSERALTKRRTRGFQRIKLTKRIKLENLEQTKYLLRLEIKMFIMTSLISLIQLTSSWKKTYNLLIHWIGAITLNHAVSETVLEILTTLEIKRSGSKSCNLFSWYKDIQLQTLIQAASLTIQVLM